MPARLRRNLFWFLDSLKGSKIKKHLNEVQYMNEHPDSRDVDEARRKYMDAILLHCSATVPFYQKLSLEKAQLEDFPVVNKNYIREQSGAFLSESYRAKKLYAASTSGSTGTPFTVYHDKNKGNRNTADTLYFAEKAGYSLGSPLFFMRIWAKGSLKRILRKIAQNVHQVDVTALDKQGIERVLENLSIGVNNKSMLAYASAYDTICEHLNKTQPHFSNTKIRSIISMSEALTDHTKYALEKYFNCLALSRYSNRENGILSQQIPGFEKNFMLNQASYYFEVLEVLSDKPVEHGKMGRIVVTDYFNYSMPLVRYDTGDLGMMRNYNYSGKKFTVLEQIEGRRMDSVYNTEGKMISSFIFPNKLRRYSEIRQFQFIQLGPKIYTFKLSTSPEFYREKELISEFKKLLGEDATIEIRYVNEIPLLASGKRKKVVNAYRSV